MSAKTKAIDPRIETVVRVMERTRFERLKRMLEVRDMRRNDGRVRMADEAKAILLALDAHDATPKEITQPGTLAYAKSVHDDMTDQDPKEGETETDARARRDYYRGYDDDGLPSD